MDWKAFKNIYETGDIFMRSDNLFFVPKHGGLDLSFRTFPPVVTTKGELCQNHTAK